jgi:phosphoglycerol transferase MdoB-like AlkP superfamily enzyme
MNNFFGGQGFDIVDRDRGNPLSDEIKTKRYAIEDKEVNFENAWGICDEDLYKQSIKYADKSTKENKPFFQFVMTTSNHKPYTFPNGKIDLPQGERDAAVKYTDYALGKFIATAKTKPWFKNTVFLIVADHCSKAVGNGKSILPNTTFQQLFIILTIPEKIDRLTSQIDLMPTLFGYLNWNYKTSLYGKDINQTKPEKKSLPWKLQNIRIIKE